VPVLDHRFGDLIVVERIRRAPISIAIMSRTASSWASAASPVSSTASAVSIRGGFHFLQHGVRLGDRNFGGPAFAASVEMKLVSA